MSLHKDQLRHALNISVYVSLYTFACLLILFLGSTFGLSFPIRSR
jgi:hypothetical protein